MKTRKITDLALAKLVLPWLGKLLVLGCLFALSSCTYLPDSANYSQAGVVVTDSRNALVLQPSTATQLPLGFMFVPGALVDPAAYIEALAPLVRAGYPVIIAKLPSNLAVLDPLKSLNLRSLLPSVSRWVVGGHSLGGSMAATAVNSDRSAFAALVFLAAYPASSDSLADWSGKVLSISADQDGLATPAKIDAAKSLLPSSTSYLQIAGGCHAYFGSYGSQDGDGTPTISRANQQNQTATAILNLLTNL